MDQEKFETYLSPCICLAREQLQKKWESWTVNPNNIEVHETIGGLMARQVSLFVQIVSNPGIWNGHVGPLVLRSMVDTYINFCWIWGSPVERAQAFIQYGLGQEKLNLEHLKKAMQEAGDDPDQSEVVNDLTTWIDTQRWRFLTDVNVGSWSGKSTRAMAEEAGCKEIYNHAYQPFSAPVHSMWNHIAKYNLQHCNNPLHKYHRIPIDPEMHLDISYVVNAAKYVEKTFHVFDQKIGVESPKTTFLDRVEQSLSQMVEEIKNENEGE